MTGTKLLHLWFEVNIEISKIVLGTQQTLIFRDVLYNCLLRLYNIMYFVGNWTYNDVGVLEVPVPYHVCIVDNSCQKTFSDVEHNLNTRRN